MTLPINSGPDSKPFPLDVNTPPINQAKTSPGLAQAGSSITSATIDQPSQKNSTGIRGFFAWICNCCKTTTTEAPTERPKAEALPIPLINDLEEMPTSKDSSSQVDCDATVPGVLSSFVEAQLPIGPDEIGMKTISANKKTISPLHLPLPMSISERQESDDDNRIPAPQNTFVEPVEGSAGKDAKPLVDLPPSPIVKESATGGEDLQPSNSSDLVAKAAPASSWASEEANADEELEKPIPSSSIYHYV